MKNNQNILIIVLILQIFYLFTSCSNNNYNDLIYSRWGIRLPFVLTSSSLVSKQTFYGTISFRISEENKKELLMQDLGKYGYSQWSKLHDGFIIGEINIMGKDFLVCTAKDEGRYEFKKIFLNKSSNILIFVDYNWSGYQDITRNLVFVSGFIGWLADKGNEEIETYLKSEEIRTNKDIFTETRVVPKEQGE